MNIDAMLGFYVCAYLYSPCPVLVPPRTTETMQDECTSIFALMIMIYDVSEPGAPGDLFRQYQQACDNSSLWCHSMPFKTSPKKGHFKSCCP